MHLLYIVARHGHINLLIFLAIFTIVVLPACSSGGKRNNKGDTTRPQTTLTFPVSAAIIHGSVQIKWETVDENPNTVQIKISDDGGASFVDLTGQLADTQGASYNWDTTQHADGNQYRIQLIITDVPGNSAVVTSNNFTIDNTSPIIEIANPANGRIGSRQAMINWTSDEENHGTVEITLFSGTDSTVLAAAAADNGSFTWDASSFAEASNYRIQIVATDGGGLTSDPTITGDLTVDNTPPILAGRHAYFSQPKPDGFKVHWEAPVFTDGSVDFRVYHSNSTNLTSVDDVLANATPAGDWVRDTTAFTITGMPTAYDLNWVVLAKDSVQNMNLYPMASPTGLLDISFGVDLDADGNKEGFNYTADNTFTANSSEIIIDTNNRLLVAGNFNADMALWRYDAGGIPDTTFGDDDPDSPDKLGYTTHDNAAGGSGFDKATSVAMDGNKILVLGLSKSASSEELVLWRYLDGGVLDDSFGDIDTNNPLLRKGYTVVNSGGYSRGWDMVIGTTHIYAVGEMDTGSGTAVDMAVWAFNRNNGDLDGFGGTGFVTDSHGTTGATVQFGYSILLDNNNLVVAGTDNNNVVLWRMDQNGDPDTGFGDDDPQIGGSTVRTGYATFPMQTSISANSTEAIKLGNFYYVKTSHGSNFSILRFNNSGILDTEYNGSGLITITNSSSPIHNALGLDLMGKLLVFGGASQFTSMNIWRFNADGTPDFSFNGRGFSMLGIGESYPQALTVDSQNRIVVSGKIDLGVGPYPAWFRYNP